MTDDRLSREGVLALRGLRLPAVALKELQRAGIYCQPGISIEFQQSARRYVLRGVESGGAVARFGAYCGFMLEDGAPLTSTHPVNSIAVNGLHLAVLSPVLVRIQMFRTGTVCELLITHHALSVVEGKTRPRIESSVLFHGRDGRLHLESCGKDVQLRKRVELRFYSRSGEQITALARFHDVIVRATSGACCIGCRHAHVAEHDYSYIDPAIVCAWQSR